MSKNHKTKNVIFIDVDGTLFDSFRKDDNYIINKIFGNNFIIKFIDSILWRINSLDIISNSMRILKLRFFIYALFSFKSYNYVKAEYEKLYKLLLNMAINKIDTCKLSKITEKYQVVIITNNPYSVDVVCKYFKEVLFSYHNRNRLNNIETYCRENKKVSYIVGNNLYDDIKIAEKLGCKSIYIGKREFIKANYKVSSFDEAMDTIIEH